MEKLTVRNREGNELSLVFRKYHEGDEEGMIACIRDEYGETYFKRNFYDPSYLKKQEREGRITFLVAETEKKEIAGMMILKRFYPEENMCEMASQIFLKKYRGYGIAVPFIRYGMRLLLSEHYFAAYSLPVLFHNVTQRLLYREGFRATGFMLNVFDMDTILHSYDRDKNRKHSLGIQIMAIEKQDAGVLCLPKEHWEFCQKIYDSLGVVYKISDGKKGVPERERSDIAFTEDERQNSLEIRVRQIGRDLVYRIRQLHTLFPLKGKQTANILLNCNDGHAVGAYKMLKGMGYFFTGLKPLCSEREYMVLHHPGKVEIYFGEYALHDDFAQMVQYIKNCYEERQTEGGWQTDEKEEEKDRT